MQSLESYVAGKLAEDDASIEEVNHWISQTHAFFARCEFDFGSEVGPGRCWSYWALNQKTDDSHDIEAPTRTSRAVLSQSTNSMILAALLAPKHVMSNRASAGVKASDLFNKIDWSQKVRADLEMRAKSTRTCLEAAWNDENGGKEAGSLSETYGRDDVFTLSWYFDIFASSNDSTSTSICENLVDKAIQRANDWLQIGDRSRPAQDLLSVDNDSTTRVIGDSSYILLRFSRLLVSIYHNNRYNDIDGVIETITMTLRDLGEIFRTRLHDQLSCYEIEDAGFDPAELAFCFEGLSHCYVDMVTSGLFDRVFDVISASQAKTPHLRTEKPVITRHTGEALFTVSVETMNSLLASLSMFDSRRPYKMMSTMKGVKYATLFSRYFEWLRTRRTAVRVDKQTRIFGWHSEHINDSSLIHTWETSQVLEFLHFYRDLLLRCSANNLLIMSQAKFQFFPKKTSWETLEADFEPVTQFTKHQIYSQIGNEFIRPHTTLNDDLRKNWSMLVYGPPGTGKSTLAKNMASSIGGQFIELTVSDFLASGSAQMESRAKAIFEMLSHQPRSVVLLDEMDQFFLDRNSDIFEQQESIVQFLTPGMLTKLANLRAVEKVIFIVATNFEDRIDPAIKRKGRIDKTYLLLPPDGAKRLEILTTCLRESGSELAKEIEKHADLMKAVSCFLGYKDIEEIVGRRPDSIACLVTYLADAVRSIRVSDYRRRWELVKESAVPGQGLAEEIERMKDMSTDLSTLRRRAGEFDYIVDKLHADYAAPLEALKV